MAGHAVAGDDRGMTYEPPTQEDRGSGLSTALDDLRSARRSADDRVVAGVLGGLGRHLGIDPVILRVTTVVLAIFGGVGILLYALGWLLMPRDDAPSLLDEARGRSGQRSPGTVPMAIVLGIVAVFAASNFVTGSWDGRVLFLLAAAGLYVLLRRRDEIRREVPVSGGTAGTAWEPMHGVDAPVGAAPPPGYDGGWPDGPDWDAAGARPAWEAPTTSDPTLPAPEPVPAGRSSLTAITLGLAGIAALAVFVNDVTWAEIPSGMYVAAPLTVVALGLLASVRRRRAKGLIATGILLSVLLVPVTAIGGAVQPDLRERPTTLAEVENASFDYPAGDFTYDLTAVPFTDGDIAHVEINQVAGELTLQLPPEVDVTVRYSGGFGDVRILGEIFEGPIDEQTVRDYGTDGAGGGSITLDIDFGFGDMEVTR